MGAGRDQPAFLLLLDAAERCHDRADALPWWAFIRRFVLHRRARRIESFVCRHPQQAMDLAVAYREARTKLRGE